METITTIKVWTKESKTKVIINDKHFLSPAAVKNQTGIGSNYNVLVGSSIEVDYFKVDDVINEENSLVCTKDNTIVKSFTIDLSPMLQQYALAAAFGTTVSFK